MVWSSGVTPAAVIRTSTLPSARRGLGTSTSFSPPYPVNDSARIALIMISPFLPFATADVSPASWQRSVSVRRLEILELGDVEPVVTRARHRLALERALGEVDAFWAARQGGVDAAAAATHLRAAVGALDDLIGVVTPDDVLDRVFASFCVGK